MACDNRVDETKLLKSLQAWQKSYNALLRSMGKMPEKKLYRVMVETIWEYPLDLNKQSMETLLDAVLLRVEDSKSTPQDKHLLSILERYGIKAGSTEGCPWLDADIVFFVRVSPFPQRQRRSLRCCKPSPINIPTPKAT